MRPLHERMIEAANVLEEVAEKYGYGNSAWAPWTAAGLRDEAKHVESEEDL
jgi:hypothetical protein